MTSIQQHFKDTWASSSNCDADTIMRDDYLLDLLRQPLPSSDPLPFLPSFEEDSFMDPTFNPLRFRKEVSMDDPIFVVGNKKSGNQDDYISSCHYDDVSLTSSSSSSSTSSSDQHQDLNCTEATANTARFRPYQDKKWKGSFQRLIKFKNEFGHCCVPHSYAQDAALARWVKRQRHQYKKFIDNDPTSTLTRYRLEQLEGVGFVWHSHAAAWLEKLNELKEFKKQTGSCNVPSTYPQNSSLSTWVKCQRRQYKLRVSGMQSTMTMDRFEVLKAMGFVFEPRLTSSKNAKLEMKA